MKKKWKVKCFACILLVSLSSCASVGSSNYNPEDPLEPLNRVTFEFNRFFDTFLLKPLAMAYRTVVPVIFQDIVSNFIDNLKSPVSVVNYVLQGDVDMAGMTMGRFMTNTVFGLLGTVDVASMVDIPKDRTDFGLTLAKWGMDESPYFVIPFYGSSTIRDGVGMGVDFFFQPVNIIALNPHNEKIVNLDWIRFGTEVVETRAGALELLEDLEKNSVDLYVAMRSMYLQNRKYRINSRVFNPDNMKANYDFDFGLDY